MKELLLDVGAVLKGLGPLLHFLDGKRMLVTGARGYLGRYIVATVIEANKLLHHPCEIIALDSFATGASNRDRSEWMNVEDLIFFEHDVKHAVTNVPLVMSREKPIDYVLHLAGIASPHWYKQLPEETISVAVDGSRNMLDVAKYHKARYLFSSSSEVYQTATQVPTPESYVGAVPSMNPRSCYDVSKLMGETLAYVAGQKHGLDIVVLRIFNSYGCGLSERDKRILPVIASAMVAERPVKVFNSNRRTPRRTYTPVANTVLGLFLSLLKGRSGEVYNIGLDTPELTVMELLQRIEQVTGKRIHYAFVDPPEHYETEPLRRCPDITKLKALGFQPVVDLDTGLKRFFDWALATYTGVA